MSNRIEKILTMLSGQPKDNFLRHALALEYQKLGQFADAEALFTAILTDTPSYVGSYYHLAKLLEQQQRIDEAIAWYEKGMEAAKAAGDKHAYSELQMAYEDLTY
ncbi:MAG: tetratricopeptide repeat protein [Chitinophagaceae bacterium]